ncbi:OLC1v1022583C1 [Oldenlandia corymbosa var. corymbosa]|uniref:OLC1v1022583C1 n=1 Tax=Oldenlandia corymbosa var. corymbosa TaxID=529605 RepID=A0AAV1C0Z8_OLDCO|nr:OLC1v1022583C1 [Oldenlandia corymbosa var. corymbosa]
MGFSLGSITPTDYHSPRGISQHRTEKFLHSNQKWRGKVSFQQPELKPRPVKLISCKSQCVDFAERASPNEVKKEIEECYKLIHRLGRGVVYLGSSRMGSSHPHYAQSFDLAREVAGLLDCTTWSGAGPGLMDAATQGALKARKPVGGFKIGKEAGEWTSSNFHPYLPPETYLTCRFFSARKHGLVDAVVRARSSDRTAVIALPGGIGTLDEIFEIMALIQLERIGSKLPVPFLLMNYDSFYTKLLEFLDDCEHWGTLSKGEVSSLWKVCCNNSEALEYLAEFYSLPFSDIKLKSGSCASA